MSIDVSLHKHFEQFMEKQISSGNFADENELLAVSLSLLESVSLHDEEKLESLKLQVQKGIRDYQSGNMHTCTDANDIHVFMDGAEQDSHSSS